VPFKGKILVFPEMRGSGGFMAYGRSKAYGNQPAAFLYGKGNSITILAAMNAGVPSVTDFDVDLMQMIETGDHVVVNGDEGVVEIYKKEHAMGRG
jgi:predicted aconitase with swiveling domain